MDTGEGRFEQVEFDPHEKVAEFEDQLSNLRKKFPKSKGLFTVGEELEIRGSKFKIKDISPFGMKLKLLKQE